SLRYPVPVLRSRGRPADADVGLHTRDDRATEADRRGDRRWDCGYGLLCRIDAAVASAAVRRAHPADVDGDAPCRADHPVGPAHTRSADAAILARPSRR